jgi:hypothetical protein
MSEGIYYVQIIQLENVQMHGASTLFHRGRKLVFCRTGTCLILYRLLAGLTACNYFRSKHGNFIYVYTVPSNW